MKLYKESLDRKFKIYYLEKPDPEIIDQSIEILKGFPKADLITKRNGRFVYRARVEGENYYFKKYCYQSKAKHLKNFFRSPEAIRAFKISKMLFEKEINHVRPLLAVSYNVNLFRTDSVFVTQEFASNNLADFFISSNFQGELKGVLINKLAFFLTQFYKNSFFNGDINLPGILVKSVEKDINSIDLAMVDFDNIRHFPYLSRRVVEKNLISFFSHLYSGLGGKAHSFNSEDRLQFLRLFFKYYQWDQNEVINFKEFLEKRVAAKLIKWGKASILENDSVMRKYL